MSEPPHTAPPNPYRPAITVYILYAVGIVLTPVALGGLIYAYIERGGNGDVDSHLHFQIRTFWQGLAMVAAAVILAPVRVGILIWLFWLAWIVVRIVTGLRLARARTPVRGVETLGMRAV